MGITEGNSGCFRSEENYPALLRDELDVETLRDVSCGGADTADVLRSGSSMASLPIPAQLDAVTPTTDLVTIGIGANDFSLFSRWITGDLRAGKGQIKAVGRRLGDVLRAVGDRAPDAEVVLVGYPRIADPGTTCPDRSPFTEAQLDRGFELEQRLNDAMHEAADAAGVHFADLFEASAGHGMCAEDPWVNSKDSVPGLGAAYHPLAAGQNAAAELIAGALEDHR